MRSIVHIRGLVLAACALGIGCGGGPAIDLDPGETADQAGSKSDGIASLPLGTYDLTPPFLGFDKLKLSDVIDYQLTGKTRAKGIFILTRSGSRRFLKLFDDPLAEHLFHKLAYVLSADGRTATFTEGKTTFTGALEPGGPPDVLSAAIGARTLLCDDSHKDPATFSIKVVDLGIEVSATDSRGAVYSEDDATITSGKLKITLSDTKDGPHADDSLEFAVDDLDGLAGGGTLKGTHRRIDNDLGTTQMFGLTCHLK
jgi:hypothetical protein